MKLSAALKAHMVTKGWIKADDDDAKVRGVVAEKLLAGELTAEQIASLTKDTPAPGTATNTALASKMATLEQKLDLIIGAKADGAIGVTLAPPVTQPSGAAVSPAEMLAKAGAGATESSLTQPRVSVMKATDRYSAARKGLTFPQKDAYGRHHPKSGEPVIFQNRPIDTRSQKDLAIGQAWFKYMLARNSGVQAARQAGFGMTQHDIELVKCCLHESEFVGGYGGRPEDGWNNVINYRKLNETEIKMLDPDMWMKAPLIDESGGSGGQEIVPVEFDDMIVTTPLLSGELFPFVTVRDVERGSRMKGGSITNPTFGYTAEGSAITPFDSTSFVSAFDTNIYPSVAAMELGRDFQEDSPANVGQLVMDAFGRAALNWLDKVIAIGNGTNQPQGIFNASGTTTIGAENPTSGPLAIADFEAMVAGVKKEFRADRGGRNVFLSNDTTYWRARSIPVGADDQRRVFGLTAAEYQMMGLPYKIQNDIPNNQASHVNLGFYRMYRRLGMTAILENRGRTLQLSNLDLIVLRMRWGGKLELGGAASIINNFPT